MNTSSASILFLNQIVSPAIKQRIKILRVMVDRQTYYRLEEEGFHQLSGGGLSVYGIIVTKQPLAWSAPTDITTAITRRLFPLKLKAGEKIYP